MITETLLNSIFQINSFHNEIYTQPDIIYQVGWRKNHFFYFSTDPCKEARAEAMEGLTFLTVSMVLACSPPALTATFAISCVFGVGSYVYLNAKSYKKIKEKCKCGKKDE